MSADPCAERVNRVADRLADTLTEALMSLCKLRRTHPLTDEEAATALTALLHEQGIQLNGDLLHTLIKAAQ